MKTKKNLAIIVGVFAIGVGVLTVSAMNNNDTINNKVKRVNFMGAQNVDVEYSKSEIYSALNKELEVYLDENKNEYIYSDDNLVGYLKNVDISQVNSESVTFSLETTDELLNTYKNQADAILNQVVNSNTKTRSTSNMNYELNYSNYRDDYREFVYTYTKKIDGYDTNDSITISLDENGELSSFNGARQGLFDAYQNIKIDNTEVESFIRDSMETFLEGTTDGYKVNYKFINMDNDKLVLEILIGITKQDSTDSYKTTVLKYEL